MKLLLICLLSFLVASYSAAGSFCGDAYLKEYKLDNIWVDIGTEVTEHEFGKDYVVWSLGEGEKGGKVFLLYDTQAHTFKTTKVYKSLESLTHDIRSFEFLREILESKNIFTIPEFEHTINRNLDIKYFQGRTLKSIKIWKFTKAKFVDQAKVELVIDQYTKKIMDVYLLLKSIRESGNPKYQIQNLHYGLSEPYAPFLAASITNKDGEYFDLFLKPDNIIYTTEGEFVIIDPF